MFGPLVFEYRLTMEKTYHNVLVWAHEIVAVAGTGLSAKLNIDGAVAAGLHHCRKNMGKAGPLGKTACLQSR